MLVRSRRLLPVRDLSLRRELPLLRPSQSRQSPYNVSGLGQDALFGQYQVYSVLLSGTLGISNFRAGWVTYMSKQRVGLRITQQKGTAPESS